MKTVCFGLLLVFVCQEPTPAVAPNECAIWGPDVRQFYKMTPEELAALKPSRRRAMLNLRRKYERLCK